MDSSLVTRHSSLPDTCSEPAAGGFLRSSPAPAAGAFPLWRIARELRARPVAIDPRAFAVLDRQLSDAISARVPWTEAWIHRSGALDVFGFADRPESRKVGKSESPGPSGPSDLQDLKDYEVRPDGVAVVKLHGICGRHLSWLAMECGGCDVDKVADNVREADADPAVACAPDQCASAAYWIASQADFVVVGPTADIGSVGVYCALLDESVRYDKAGVRVEMLASGPNKGAGYPGTSLTDDQRALLQSQVDYVASIFKAAVMRGRAGDEPDESILDGRCLVGAQAVAANLADAVGDLALAASYALRLAGETEEGTP